MKKSLKFVVLAALVLLGGCGDPKAPLSERISAVVDLGVVPVNDGFVLHGYRVMNNSDRDHFVYVLEKNGKPVAGTTHASEVSSGKSTALEVVASAVNVDSDTCQSVQECKDKLAALRDESARLKALQAEYAKAKTELARDVK